MTAPADRFARAYGRGAALYRQVLDPTLAPAAQRLVALADPQPGSRVLDLATGTGAVAREAYARGARVVGVDVAEGMLSVARTASPPEIAFGVAEAAGLPFEDDSFDVVTCGFALSHLADAAAALREVRRVLVAGGRFVASAWAGGENAASAAVLDELRRRCDTEIHAFAGILDERTWADAAGASRLFADAGFRVEVVGETLSGAFADSGAAVTWTLAWPDVAEAAEALPDRERRRFEDAARAAAAEAGLRWRLAVNYFVAAAG